MSEIIEITEDEAPAGAAPAKAAGKPKDKKKLIIIGAAASALLLGGGGGAFLFLGSGSDTAEAHGEAPTDADHGEAEGDHGEGEEGAAAYVEVPPMVVNLRSPDGAARFLKLRFVLVPGTASAAQIEKKLPMVLDSFQPFLRELRPEDLAGSAAIYRIKEELLVRTTATLGKGAVKDVLIQDMIQQ